MPPINAVNSAARTALTNSIDLTARLQLLSIAPKRSFHASCKCFAVASLHAPPDVASKGQGLTVHDDSRTTGPKTINRVERAKERAKHQKEEEARNAPQMGGLAPNSIFAEELPPPRAVADKGEAQPTVRNPEIIGKVLNPRPKARALWQRKMLVRSIQKRGRLTKEERILQSERSYVSKSHFFKTSMKKLAPLARQIAGKTIDEAILQMRFSKKKAAQDVREHLINARNEAIVARGMGVGAYPAALPLPGSADQDPSAVVTTDTSILPLAPTHVPTLSLKRTVEVPETQIYIAQAWVNRGPYERRLEPRAMGRANILRPPWTGISVVLKEEKTRMREKEEKENKERQKRLGKGLWKQLPDRKVYAQRPYYSW